MVFDLTPIERFEKIKLRFIDYQQTGLIEDLLPLINDLNHLRENIAPKSTREGNPDGPEAIFYHDIFKEFEFKLLKELSNNDKHGDAQRLICDSSEPEQETMMDDWRSLDGVNLFDDGFPLHKVVLKGGKRIDVIDPIAKVIEFYQVEWFDRNP